MAKLRTLQTRIQKLKSEIERAESARRAQLLALPKKYGFANLEEVAAEIQILLRGGSTARRGPGRPKGSGVKTGRRKRAVITDAMREEVKRMSTEGKTGAEISKAVGISLPSVQNIKKSFGLVKARK